MALPQRKIYTVEDIYALPEGARAELIDGVLYDMAPPGRLHQKISGELFHSIRSYIGAKKGGCEVYAAPFSVFLNADDKNYVEPDISVICDREKLDGRGCAGAPDWIIEIASPSTKHVDYGTKLFKYRTAGVREYWVVNPMRRTVNVFDLECDMANDQYSFEDEVPSCVFKGFHVRIAGLLG